MRRSKIIEACPTFDFFHPKSVEGLSIVAHGMVLLQTSINTSNTWPIAIFVTDITVDPTPVHISERLQILLNITEGPILVTNITDIETARVEASEIVEANVNETINANNAEPTEDSDNKTVQANNSERTEDNNNESVQDNAFEIIQPTSFDILQDTSAPLLNNMMDISVDEIQNDIDEIGDMYDDIDHATDVVTMDTGDVDIGNNTPIELNNISPAQTEDKSADLDNITPPIQTQDSSAETEINDKLAEMEDKAIETVDSVQPQQQPQIDEPQPEQIDQLQRGNIANSNEPLKQDHDQKHTTESNQLTQETINQQMLQKGIKRKRNKRQMVEPELLRRSPRLANKKSSILSSYKEDQKKKKAANA